MLEDQTVANKKPHSEKVPRLYKVAANILKDYDDGKDSIKNLVFNCRCVYFRLDIFSHNFLLLQITEKNTWEVLFTAMIFMKVL